MGLLQVKCHPKEWSEQYRFTSGCVMTFFITLAAALNVLALSETITSGIPRLAQNLLRQRTNVSVDMSGTTSMWMAWVTQHVYRQIHIFSLLVALTCNGPAKSTAACENGLLSRTQNFGRCGGGGRSEWLSFKLLTRNTSTNNQFHSASSLQDPVF